MISPEYEAELRALHAKDPNWGASDPRRHLPVILAADPRSVLDYGCGKGTLVRALRHMSLDADGYDPGVPAYSAKPNRTYDFLTSFDVLEHIEPEYVPEVLAHMASLADRAYLVIALEPDRSGHTLADGRNLHVSLKTKDEWLAVLREYWTTVEPGEAGRKLRVVCSR
jgi:SAM-dependent methyltransferase